MYSAAFTAPGSRPAAAAPAAIRSRLHATCSGVHQLRARPSASSPSELEHLRAERAKVHGGTRRRIDCQRHAVESRCRPGVGDRLAGEESPDCADVVPHDVQGRAGSHPEGAPAGGPVNRARADAENETASGQRCHRPGAHREADRGAQRDGRHRDAGAQPLRDDGAAGGPSVRAYLERVVARPLGRPDAGVAQPGRLRR